jgi:hypothetical protein
MQARADGGIGLPAPADAGAGPRPPADARPPIDAAPIWRDGGVAPIRGDAGR